jgi:hypothetical protein
MNPTLTPLKKFRHDTIGKFQNLKELIEYINEDNINESDSQEILIELRETFIKMANATEKLLLKNNT